MHLAEPYPRPQGHPHPDVFKVKDHNVTILRGEIQRDYTGSTRTPDVDTHMWRHNGSLREMWKRNWNGTGDSMRDIARGPAPPGYSSCAERHHAQGYAATAGLTKKSNAQYTGTGRIATWCKWSYKAFGLQTTLDPSTFKDGGPELGPKWSKVVRRRTYDMHSKQVLDDVSTKGLNLEAATGAIPHTKEGKGRDIITEFHFIRGSWCPPMGDNANASTKETKVESAVTATQTPEASKEGAKSGLVFNDHVIRTQAAMGCPLNGQVPIPAMPLLSKDKAAKLKSEHREKNPVNTPLPLNAMVARPVGRKERDDTPAALDAVAKEWKRLRSIKHKDGVGVWDESKVQEKWKVAAEANKAGVIVHFARIFDLCVEKGSELPKDSKDRKFKGRAVLQGDQVKDQNWEAAMFQDLSSSPAAMEASRAADAYGMLPGNDIEVADADSAYTQSYLEGPVKTWVSIPKEQWPQKWFDEGFKDPVCPLVLSLYGHPDAGGYWERHCDKTLQSKGWNPIPGWRSCYWHEECQTYLIVYVDDFKMAGPAEHKARLWSEIIGDPDHPDKGGIYMGKPEPQHRFLGCEHILTKVKDADGVEISRMEYNMEGFFRKCLDRWTELTGQKWEDLPEVSTPFLDEDALRKNQGIGPLEFKLPQSASKKKPKPKQPKAKLPVKEGSVKEPAPEKVEAGVLQPIAASVLMQMLYGARYARPDLLRAISMLARKMTKWRPMQDMQLHRLVCYVKSTLSYRQYAWVGDSKEDLKLHLYTDADLASDPEDSISTSGAYFAIVGPRTHVPLGCRCRRQTAVSHSSTESEIVSADHGLKCIGLPALDLWELLLGRPPGQVGLQMFQDNDACCRICRSGKNPNMTHIGRTHRISIAWLHEQLKSNEVNMFRADSELMAADIFTKPFPDAKASVWRSNLDLINIHDSTRADNIDYHPSMVQSLRGDLDKPKSVPIENATLAEDDDAEKVNLTASPGLLLLQQDTIIDPKKASKDRDDDEKTNCPEEDDAEVADLSDDEGQFNDEWSTLQSDWTNDFPEPNGPDIDDIFAECAEKFDDGSARALLAKCGKKAPKGMTCIFATPAVAPKPAEDYWEINDTNLVRHHVVPRTTMFSVSKANMPKGISRKSLTGTRKSVIEFKDRNGRIEVVDDFNAPSCARRYVKDRWTGTTTFHVCAKAGGSDVGEGTKRRDGSAPAGSKPESQPKGEQSAEVLSVKMLHPNATIPKRGTPKSAGFDVTSVEPTTIQPNEQMLIKTGIAVACPSGTYARIAPRSGLALKHRLSVGAGVVDADYRG